MVFLQPAFEADFVFPEDGQELTLKTYVRNLRKWRDHFEAMLDQRPQKMYLEQFSPWLSDFQFQKFDEVEVPGQYLQVLPPLPPQSKKKTRFFFSRLLLLCHFWCNG
jgi:phosphatidylinositol kinase/protein kinase (PI-3  family)